MHQPSRRNRAIGIVGLIWFLYCTATAVLIPLFPQDFREWSKFTWTDREIRIGAACYFVAGLGGAVLAVTRLLLPMFAPKPRIGDNAAAVPLMSIHVQPRFEDFCAMQASASARSADVGALLATFGGVVIFIMLIHPGWRRDGMTFGAAATLFGGVLAARVGYKYIVRRTLASMPWWFRLQWKLFSRHREPRLCHVFEDGVLMQGQTFTVRLPWYDVEHARCLDEAIGLVGRKQLVLIPIAALPSPAALDQLMALLERKGVLRPTS